MTLWRGRDFCRNQLELLSPARMEALAKASGRSFPKDFVVKEFSGTTLARDDDARIAVPDRDEPARRLARALRGWRPLTMNNDEYEDKDEHEDDDEGAALPTVAPSRAVGSLQDLKRGLTNAKAAAPTRTIKPLARMMKAAASGSTGAKTPRSRSPRNGRSIRTRSSTATCAGRNPEPPANANSARSWRRLRSQSRTSWLCLTRAHLGPSNTGLDMKCVSGADKGLETAFRNNAQGGIEAVLALIDAVDQQLDWGSDKIVPIVRLRSTSYQHPAYGKTYKPVFEIVGWTRIDEEPTGSTSTPPPAGGGGTGEPIRRRRVAA